MKRSDYEKLFLETEDGTFTPIYTCTEENPIYDEEENIIDWDLIDYVEVMSAEEHYQKWLNDKEKPVEKPEDKVEVLKEEVIALEKENKLLKAQVEALSQTSDFHEELIVEMANKVYA